MKTKFALFLTILISSTTNAQVPEKMSYQAIIRDADNKIVTNHTIGIRISILQGSASGNAVYTETQTPITNANGLIAIEIGGGSGFNLIKWENGPYFLSSEIDPTGGTNYTISGTSQFSSVPYAMYANSVKNLSGSIPSVGDLLYFNGNQWTSIAQGLPGQNLRLSSSKIPEWYGPSFPILTTTELSEITRKSALSGGNIQSNGGEMIFIYGICWSTSPNPTINDSKTLLSSQVPGLFSSSLTGLIDQTTYFVRAYATNKVGTGYGNEISFTSGNLTPEVITGGFSEMTSESVTCDGIIYFNGEPVITARGICWSLTTNPTIEDNHTTDGTGGGQFKSRVTGLSENNTYHLRGYATNSSGTYYGNELSYSTYSGTVTDIDGNIYRLVNIGQQFWMAENLKTTRYSNGDLIGTTDPPGLDISPFVFPKYQWAYGGIESNSNEYGRLYTWFAVNDNRNICPTGWHVPNQTDWATLFNNLGGVDLASKKLIETGISHWKETNSEVTNESRFSALPGGYRYGSGSLFSGLGDFCFFWSSTERSAPEALYYFLTIDSNAIQLKDSSFYKHDGCSVRCIKD